MSLASPSARRTDGADFRVAVVAARFNEELVDALLRRFTDALLAAGVRAEHLEIHRVPGSHEVPWGIARLARARRHDCLVALGLLVGGDTNHHEMVGASVSHALQHLAITHDVPVINGVIVTDTPAQARARCTGRIDRGAEFARAALEMAALHRRLAKKS